MPKAVVFGAGNIGRGFLGQILAESGWEIVFVEADGALIDLLNRRGGYTIHLVSDDDERLFEVGNVRALDCRGAEAVHELASADLAATAVGVRALKGVAPVIAGALAEREKRTGRPLDIIICENLIGAGGYLRAEVARHLPPENAGALNGLGLVEASIGRMVPVVTVERRASDPLGVWVEPYCELPVDAAGFRGPVPGLAHLMPYAPFDFYIQRKLFLHNAGHALAAYLGRLAGYTYIWEAVSDGAVGRAVAEGMAESAWGLSREHGVPLEEILDSAEDLRRRFANRALGDTVARVGRDPLRKLGPEDRLVGAARLAERHGKAPRALARGIAAALCFDEPGDGEAVRLQSMLAGIGLAGTLEKVCRLEPGEPLFEAVAGAWRAMIQRA